MTKTTMIESMTSTRAMAIDNCSTIKSIKKKHAVQSIKNKNKRVFFRLSLCDVENINATLDGVSN